MYNEAIKLTPEEEAKLKNTFIETGSWTLIRMYKLDAKNILSAVTGPFSECPLCDALGGPYLVPSEQGFNEKLSFVIGGKVRDVPVCQKPVN